MIYTPGVVSEGGMREEGGRGPAEDGVVVVVVEVEVLARFTCECVCVCVCECVCYV